MERLGTVAIVGVGLIGGSIGLALRARGLADRVIGIGRDRDRLAEAVTRGAIDEAETQLSRGVAHADVAVICTPVGRIAEDCILAASSGPSELLVTDAGSTKGEIVAAIERIPTACKKFVAAHPIAGSEKSGVGAASADLFTGRTCILTPTALTSPDRLERARKFWGSLGFQVTNLDPWEHDKILALTSHLPHVVASALANSVPQGYREFAAGAYRDGTRVAAADATLWAEIFLANKAAVLDAIDTFDLRLVEFRAALNSGDAGCLVNWWRGSPSDLNPANSK